MNNVIPAQPVVGTRDGNWIWDGTRWVCDPDCFPFPTPCPSPFPPAFSGPAQQPPWYPGANGGVSFGATAPPNPVRGHFWWNGVALQMFDGAAWVVVGGAGATGTPPSSTAPANPVPGQQWFNGTTLFVWDGNAWVPVSQTKTSIQATAPVAPNPGDLWFDGTQLRIWSGSAWMLVGPGATVGPVATSTAVFSVTASGYFPAPTAWDIVTITSTPTIDTMAGWDPATKKWKPNKAGFYLFECTMWELNGGGIALVKNDQGTFVNDQNHPALGIDTSSVNGFLTFTTTAMMNGTTDYVRLFGFSVAAQFWGNPSPPLLGVVLLP